MALLEAGRTCWRTPAAARIKVLIDGQDYFLALLAALRAARRSVWLLGWSFDPRTHLVPGDPDTEIARLLIDLSARGVDVRLLVWRSALPIAITQEFLPHRAKERFRNTPVRFVLDDSVPMGACHHQKVAVIDDALAFVGGTDLGPDRWDTPAHLDDDPGRRSPDGARAPPRHEVMALVTGAPARELGALCRDRWRAAVGERLEPDAQEAAADPWPAGVTPDLAGPAAVARTLPAWRDQDAVREIGALTLAAIAEAKSLIYLENQYFTSPLVVEALAVRLAEQDGPEIVFIGPEHSPSYFDRITMDRARSNALWRLASSDVFGRFHALAPHAPNGRPIVVHAKVMIVDDRLVRISSANLNNRSLGFDTECELAFEAGAPAERAAVTALRDRMAGHWVGRTGAEVAELRRGAGSLSEALWALNGAHRLRRLAASRLGPVGEFIADFHIGDPTETADSWRPALRRNRLIAAARRLRLRLASRC